MRILFIGDIVGSVGRDLISENLAKLKEIFKLDCIIANAENAAAGRGITSSIAEELRNYGVDALTLGDHVWDQKGFEEVIDQLDFVCRPANLLAGNPGRTHLILKVGSYKVGVATLLGQVFLKMPVSCPFRKADKLVEEFKQQGCDFTIFEVHAEATSEKVALGWYLDGRTHALLGTHTHIPTSDNRLLPKGTIYQTDLGMTGPYKSILGRQIAPVLNRFITGRLSRWPVAEEDLHICGAIMQFSPEGGQTTTQALIYPAW